MYQIWDMIQLSPWVPSLVRLTPLNVTESMLVIPRPETPTRSKRLLAFGTEWFQEIVFAPTALEVYIAVIGWDKAVGVGVIVATGMAGFRETATLAGVSPPFQYQDIFTDVPAPGLVDIAARMPLYCSQNWVWPEPGVMG
jgi:hypothetical protein